MGKQLDTEVCGRKFAVIHFALVSGPSGASLRTRYRLLHLHLLLFLQLFSAPAATSSQYDASVDIWVVLAFNNFLFGSLLSVALVANESMLNVILGFLCLLRSKLWTT